MNKASTVEEYFASIENQSHKAALTHVRELIREVCPDASEVISYSMPAFRAKKVFIYYAAFKNHISLFPGGSVANYADELKGFEISKGTIKFSPEKMLPDELIKRIAHDRMHAAGG